MNGVDMSKHAIGNLDCDECYWKPMKHTCGGLIHSDTCYWYSDEDEGFDIYLECDKCNETWLDFVPEKEILCQVISH